MVFILTLTVLVTVTPKQENVCFFYVHYERIIKMIVTQLQLHFARYYMVLLVMSITFSNKSSFFFET